MSFAVINHATTTTTKSQPVEEKDYFVSHLQLRVRQERNSRQELEMETEAQTLEELGSLICCQAHMRAAFFYSPAPPPF